MVFSFLHPSTCGFARGIAWEISKNVDDEWKFGDADARAKLKKSCQITERYNRFTAVFESCKENFAMDLKVFRKILPDLRKKFAGWSRRIHERNQYTATFNMKSWKNLPATQKVQHVFRNCRACEGRFVAVQSLFPVKSTQFLGRTRPDCSFSINDAAEACINEQRMTEKSCSKRQAVETAHEICNKLNPSFESACKMPLSSALINVEELQLQQKTTKNEKRKQRRSLYKKSKQATEAEWAKTDVVRYSTFMQILSYKEKQNGNVNIL